MSKSTPQNLNQESNLFQLQVAVPVPLRQTFDYLHDAKPTPGTRVLVPFGRRKLVGIVISTHSSSTAHKLKRIERQLDQVPIFNEKVLQLLNWGASYYHHPIGETLHTALPVNLRKAREIQNPEQQKVYQRKQGLSETDCWEKLNRAPKQRQLWTLIPEDRWITQDEIELILERGKSITPLIQALLDKQLIVSQYRERDVDEISVSAFTEALNPEQQAAIDDISKGLGQFTTTVVYGVTGSGKTEVYLHAAEKCLSQGKQVLVLVPEIALTPQLLERFKQRLGSGVLALHSNMSSNERYRTWWAGLHGKAKVILGTRSAIFAPFKKLGLIVIDEEHDHSFKQFDGFRYHARDLAIKRASLENIPIVLGSATPSVETMRNAKMGRFQLCRLRDRAAGASMPSVELIDLKQHPHRDGLSPQLITALKQQLANKEQSILFINRRGFAPVAQCSGCGWQAKCSRCDAFMTFHHHANEFRCHHCGQQSRAFSNCPECRKELFFSGIGTQRIEAALATIIPEARVIRFDRDEITNLDKLEAVLENIKNGKADIIVGTQLIAKGHDFAKVTLVGVINSDQGLYSMDFRAPEYLVQQITQVAGRAGRGESRGRVLIQTAHPQNPYLQIIQNHDHHAFYTMCLNERNLLHLPPFGYLALWRAESTTKDAGLYFLGKLHTSARGLLQTHYRNSVEIMDPVKSPMEKLAGRYRAQLLVKAKNRSSLHQFIHQLLHQIQSAKISRTVRWSIDIDPMDIY